MSIDHEAVLIVGFKLFSDDGDDQSAHGKKRLVNTEIPKRYIRHQAEKSHVEDRYDQKTGKKLEPEKIIDEEACDVYVLDGTTFCLYELQEFAECIAQKAGGSLVITGNMQFGALYFHVVCDGLEEPIEIYELIKKEKELVNIGKELVKMGFDVGLPTIYSDLVIV